MHVYILILPRWHISRSQFEHVIIKEFPWYKDEVTPTWQQRVKEEFRLKEVLGEIWATNVIIYKQEPIS